MDFLMIFNICIEFRKPGREYNRYATERFAVAVLYTLFLKDS